MIYLKDREFQLLDWINWGWLMYTADSNKDMVEMLGFEGLAIIAWFVTAWAWTTAIRELLELDIWIYLENYIEEKSIERTFKVDINATAVWIWGSSFYAWYGRVQSAVEWKNMYSWKWLAESIAYVWAFKWLAAIYSKMGLVLNPFSISTEAKINRSSINGLNCI